MNKTNQFNLTTRRYTREQMQQIVEDAGKRVFLYQVTDAFGDNGIVAAAIVDTDGELPEITDRKSTRLNSSHSRKSRMPSSA